MPFVIYLFSYLFISICLYVRYLFSAIPSLCVRCLVIPLVISLVRPLFSSFVLSVGLYFFKWLFLSVVVVLYVVSYVLFFVNVFRVCL